LGVPGLPCLNPAGPVFEVDTVLRLSKSTSAPSGVLTETATDDDAALRPLVGGLTKTVLTGKELIQGTPVGERAVEAELGHEQGSGGCAKALVSKVEDLPKDLEETWAYRVNVVDVPQGGQLAVHRYVFVSKGVERRGRTGG
jgi:hypothetical protein